MPREESDEDAALSLHNDIVSLHKSVEVLREEVAKRELTASLMELSCQRSLPALSDIRGLVQQGASVTGAGLCSFSPLHRWLREGRVQLVMVLLETKNAINFFSLDEEGDTPFHSLFSGPAKSDEVVRTLMTAMVDRLDSSTADIAEEKDEIGISVWEVRNAAGYDVLHLAISTHQLSVVYPLIKERQYFANRTTPLRLEVCPDANDWSRLSNSQQARLQCPSVNAYSVSLYDEVVKDLPDVPAVRRFVLGGADILYASSGQTALHYSALTGDVEVLKALLETQKDVNFTTVDAEGCTPLHYVTWCVSSRVAEVTDAIIRRLQAHPNDQVDWGKKNKDGCDFLSLAARDGVLSDVYRLVKDQPYYREANRLLLLVAEPLDADQWLIDWSRLSPADQPKFKTCW